MAIESVAPGSNVIPFPTAPAAYVRRARVMGAIIGAEALSDIHLTPESSDDALCLVGSRIRFEALQRQERGDTTPRMLSITACGRLDEAGVAHGFALAPGAQFVAVVTAATHEGAIARRLRDVLDGAMEGAKRHG